MNEVLDPGLGLTPRQKEVLDYVQAHLASHGGVCPSLGEIAVGIGVKTASTVHRILSDIKARGWITMTPNKPRSIQIVRRHPAS